MKTYKLTFSILAIIFTSLSVLHSQTFSVESYKKFLEQTKNLTAEGLYSLYPPGVYNENNVIKSDVEYLKIIQDSFKLTDYEYMLLNKNSFMVSERLDYGSFWAAYKDIFSKDLPVFITSDAILHAIHMSYDAILQDIEKAVLIPKLKTILQKMYDYIPTLKSNYSANQEMLASINDIDVYITVALQLLNDSYLKTNFEENIAEKKRLIDFIKLEYPQRLKMFSDNCRIYDFSQFTVRGHYTQDVQLGNYFKAMIWLGRTEFYLIPPITEECTYYDIDIRQIVDAALILECTESSEAIQDVEDMDLVILSMVGESDNVKLEHIRELLNEAKITDASELLKRENANKFLETLMNKPYSDQKILSQILYSDPLSPEQLKPASAFMFFGQRFIIDSYVSANVVYDRIIYNEKKIRRMLPLCYDILFSLGNNAAGDLLKPEFIKYPYAANLASLRYLIESYNDEFWESSVYNSWLNLIRALNPPGNNSRKSLPKYMQTAAWWQSKMNTQLASWAQLRHDNLLYAKQSYTGGVSCSYPKGYLEPVPDFYHKAYKMAQVALEKVDLFLKPVPTDDGHIKNLKERIIEYYKNVKDVMSKLEVIAGKEIKNEPLTNEEMSYLTGIFKNDTIGCGDIAPSSWYSDLFYFETKDAQKVDYVVADVHTAPTDEFGNPVGWVWHVGTGTLNLAVIITKCGDGRETAFVGPMMSFYEYVSLNFERWTDEEWKEAFNKNENPALRPAFADLYLATIDGKARSTNPVSLPTDTEDDEPVSIAINSSVVFPNPSNDKVYITFSLPMDILVENVSVGVFDLNGNLINELFRGELQGRSYTVMWDCKDKLGNKISRGTYIYKIMFGSIQNAGKIILQ